MPTTRSMEPMPTNPLSFTVTQRANDWHACVTTQPGTWGCGPTPSAALESAVLTAASHGIIAERLAATRRLRAALAEPETLPSVSEMSAALAEQARAGSGITGEGRAVASHPGSAPEPRRSRMAEPAADAYPYCGDQ